MITNSWPTGQAAGETFFPRVAVESQGAEMEIKTVKVEMPENANVIIGQSHFIKTAEDLYEAVVGSVPQAKFGVAFCEASGPCLIRVEGNDDALKVAASKTAMDIGAGHTFVVFLRDAYPVNVLNSVKQVHEVCSVFCATANPLEVLVAENGGGRGIIGVIDGERPKGIETPKDVDDRKKFLRMIGYKR